MAQHDFAPAWLNFPTHPSSTKSSLNIEKNTEGIVRPDSRYDVNRRRHNSSDAFDAAFERSNGFGRKEKNGWRSQGRNGGEHTSYRGSYNGIGSRSRSSTFHGKSQHENTSPNDIEKGDWERRKQFESEEFPSLNPDYERELNQNKSVAAGVWEYPLNTKSRTSRMLVIRKGMKDDFSLSGYPITTSSRISPVKNGTGVFKGLAPNTVNPNKEPCISQPKENSLESPVCLDSVQESFSPNTSLHTDLIVVSQNSLEEAGDSSSLHNGICSYQERDINQNFDKIEIPQGNGNTLISSPIIRSATFPQTDVLSSSLEAEHRLLKEMGWQEDSENDETYAPLTEDELREFQAISEQLQKNGLRKHGFLKNGLTFDLKFTPWKISTFNITAENEDTETSSSDTSDDDDV
ncbi:vasculin isoform 1-T3 [Discoglossus pictus]